MVVLALWHRIGEDHHDAVVVLIEDITRHHHAVTGLNAQFAIC